MACMLQSLLLVLICVNDMHASKLSKLLLFADDVKLYKAAQSSCVILKLCDPSEIFGFNMSKCHVVIFERAKY